MQAIFTLIRKYWFPTIGLLCGIFGVASWVYTEYVKRGEVTVTVVSEGAVLDVRRDLPDLVVLFRSEDLRASDQSLRFYSFVVRNTGTSNITKNMFDDQIGWGVEFGGANFIRVSDFSTTATLLRVVQPNTSPPKQIKFSPAIFDSGQSFKFDALVVHSKTSIPTLTLFGGISGTELRLVESGAEPASPSFLRQMLAGGFLTQIARVAAYGVAFILLLVATGGIALTAISIVAKRERRRWVNENVISFGRQRSVDALTVALVSATYVYGDYFLLMALKDHIKAELTTRSAQLPLPLLSPKWSDTDEGRRLSELEERLAKVNDAFQDPLQPLALPKVAKSVGLEWESWLKGQSSIDLSKVASFVEEVTSRLKPPSLSVQFT